MLARSLDDAHAEQRRIRPELDAGIGGSTRTGSLKCLHAHAAFALARPGYELGDRILAELPALWPDVLLYSVTWTSTLRAISGRTGSAASRARGAIAAATPTGWRRWTSS